MSHSHLVVQHLLKQLESWQPGQGRRDVRPEWLTELITETAELFEPITGVARVGFDCCREENAWVVRMYLGSTEIIGGPLDGKQKPVSFELNLRSLLTRFDAVDEFFWSVFPTGADEVEEPQAYVTIAGRVADTAVQLHMFATAPPEVGPGLKLFPNGEFSPV